jgi:hypothetical protein
MINVTRGLVALLLLALTGCIDSPLGSRVYVTTDGGRPRPPDKNLKAFVYTEPHVSTRGISNQYLTAPDRSTQTQLVRVALTTWLQKHGLTMLTIDRVANLDEQQIRPTEGDANALQMGKLLGADLAVRYVTTANASQISVEAVDVESGIIVWTGSALTDSEPRPEMIRLLTCHALATAWGLEPAGHHDVHREEAC